MRVDFKEPWSISFGHAVILFIFAAAIFLAVNYAMKNVFDVAWPLAPLWGFAACAVVLTLNCFYIISGEVGRRNILVGLGPILVVAVIVGLFFSVAWTMSEFREDFLKQENVRREVASARARIDELEEQEKRLRVEAEYLSRRNVDDDPAVSPFLRPYQRASDNLDKAEKKQELICILKEICMPYESPARRERLVGLKQTQVAANGNLEAARLQARNRVERAVAELGRKERELAEARSELKRIERPGFRPHAFTNHAFREMKLFILFIPLYVLLHMVPVMLPKDDVRRRARMNREARNRPKDAKHDQITLDPSAVFNGSK